MTYAIDFDGTLCTDRYPEIGEPKIQIIKLLKQRKENGDKLILWTCREGEQLDQAVEWCKKQGLEFDAINDNLQENIEKYQNNCRKVNADYYIDDKALSLIG